MTVSISELPFLELLRSVIVEPDPYSEDDHRCMGYMSVIPSDILSSDFESGLILGRVSDRLFRQCLAGMEAANEDGDLEYMSPRDIEKILWRLVCEVWTNRNSLDVCKLTDRIDAFVGEHSKPQEEWTVLWEIDFLELSEPLNVEEVTIMSLTGDMLSGFRWADELRLFGLDETLRGSAFARATVLAGSHKTALLRAKPVIDDALDILRVTFSYARYLPSFQKLYRRGMRYFAYPSSIPTEGTIGMESVNLESVLGISGDMRTLVDTQLRTFAPIFERSMPEAIREPLWRSLTLIGRSMTRSDPDSQILDLCSALESVLCTATDPLKAQRITLRYMLMGFDLDKAVYANRSFGVYDVYLMRNDIIHGSRRRVSSSQDSFLLRGVAKETVEWLLELSKKYPEASRLDQLFEVVERVESLETIIQFIESHLSSTQQASKPVRQLAVWWLERARLRAFCQEQSLVVREYDVSRDYEVLVYPCGIKLKRARAEGKTSQILNSDPAEAHRLMLEQLKTQIATD
ncbi:MAG: hypothetical protein KC435_08560 [Thermomicrobiales bacterium]|nr:hypothetical protein [Thermomicrobiales bacterium]